MIEVANNKIQILDKKIECQLARKIKKNINLLNKIYRKRFLEVVLGEIEN